MEKFKVIEKEMKTKAYSREGLIMSGRLDPKEKEKTDLCAWVTERVDSLNLQIEAMEAEVETLQTSSKKGKNNPSRERISELEDKIERHKWHQGRLELILRLLENGQIDLDKVRLRYPYRGGYNWERNDLNQRGTNTPRSLYLFRIYRSLRFKKMSTTMWMKTRYVSKVSSRT
jgi:hypothetical protein